jgi:hypothetical protein
LFGLVLDELFSKGIDVGYVTSDFPSVSDSRVTWALKKLAPTTKVDDFRPMPVFPNCVLANELRSVFIDAGLFAGQLAQVPQMTPEHPWDDANRGPIYSPKDPRGKILHSLQKGLESIQLPWLQHCFLANFDGSEVLEIDPSILRKPVDLAYPSDLAEVGHITILKGE